MLHRQRRRWCTWVLGALAAAPLACSGGCERETSAPPGALDPKASDGEPQGELAAPLAPAPGRGGEQADAGAAGEDQA